MSDTQRLSTYVTLENICGTNENILPALQATKIEKNHSNQPGNKSNLPRFSGGFESGENYVYFTNLDFPERRGHVPLFSYILKCFVVFSVAILWPTIEMVSLIIEDPKFTADDFWNEIDDSHRDSHGKNGISTCMYHKIQPNVDKL